MEAMPTVSSSVEKLPQIPHISLTQRHQTTRHPEKCSKPENDAICGLKTHPNVHFRFIPTHSSWLNQIECWFSILSRAALQGSSFTSVRMLVQTIEAFIASWNQNAAPFEWTKKEVHQQEMKRSYAYLCN